MALERWDKHFDRHPGRAANPPTATLCTDGHVYFNTTLTELIGPRRFAQFFLDREEKPPLLIIKFVPEGEDYDRRFSYQQGTRSSMMTCQIGNMCREWRISLAKKRRFPATWDAARRTVTVRFREVEG
jgi:hypothetical protein